MNKDANKPIIFYLANPPTNKKYEASSQMILKFSLKELTI